MGIATLLCRINDIFKAYIVLGKEWGKKRLHPRFVDLDSSSSLPRLSCSFSDLGIFILGVATRVRDLWLR